MRRLLLLPIVLSVLAVHAHAQLVVHDPIHTAMNQVNWALTEAKQGLQYIEQQETRLAGQLTALRELQQVENEWLQLEYMGDPRAIGAALPGISNITTLAAIYQQGIRDVNDIRAFTNPQSFKITAEQIEGLYGQNQWNGFASANGSRIAPAMSLINFSAANYNVANNTQQRLATLNAKKLELTQQRDAAIAQLKAASDQSAVQKQSAIIVALNGAIADVNASIAQAVHNADLQVLQNNQAREISQNAALQQQAATQYRGIDMDMKALPSSGFHQTVNW
jgi:hypothetical protein